jgi:hypothetical protein
MKLLSIERVPAGSERTITVAGGPLASTSESRPCMALVPGSGGCLTDEVHCLLHRRLRIAGLIALSGYAAVLIRNLFLGGGIHSLTSIDLALHCAVMAVLILLGALLWGGYHLSMGALG